MIEIVVELESALKEKREKSLYNDIIMFITNLNNVYGQQAWLNTSEDQSHPVLGSIVSILDLPAIERIAMLIQYLKLGMLSAYSVIINILVGYSKLAGKEELVDVILQTAKYM